MTLHRNKFLFNKTNRRTNFQIYSGTQLYTFQAAPLPIIRIYSLYTRHWHITYRSDESKQCVHCLLSSDLYKMCQCRMCSG